MPSGRCPNCSRSNGLIVNLMRVCTKCGWNGCSSCCTMWNGLLRKKELCVKCGTWLTRTYWNYGGDILTINMSGGTCRQCGGGGIGPNGTDCRPCNGTGISNSLWFTLQSRSVHWAERWLDGGMRSIIARGGLWLMLERMGTLCVVRITEVEGGISRCVPLCISDKSYFARDSENRIYNRSNYKICSAF